MTNYIIFLQTLPFTPDRIDFSESRIKEQPLTNIEISEYSFVNACPHGDAGEATMYFQNELKFAKENRYNYINAKVCAKFIPIANRKKILFVPLIIILGKKLTNLWLITYYALSN